MEADNIKNFGKMEADNICFEDILIDMGPCKSAKVYSSVWLHFMNKTTVASPDKLTEEDFMRLFYHDIGKDIAKALGLPNPESYTDHCWPWSSATQVRTLVLRPSNH